MSSNHPLKSLWKLMYLPGIDKAQITTHGSYDNACAAMLKVIGELKTVEAVCSTFNSIPKVSVFPAREFIILSREGRQPTHAAFGDDARKVTVDALTDEASKSVLELLVAAIIGDVMEKQIGENPCHVLRMAHRPGYKTPNSVRFEIWMEAPTDSQQMKAYLDDLLCGFKVEECALKG